MQRTRINVGLTPTTLKRHYDVLLQAQNKKRDLVEINAIPCPREFLPQTPLALLEISVYLHTPYP